MNEFQYLFIKSIASDLAKFNVVGDVADWIGCQFALDLINKY